MGEQVTRLDCGEMQMSDNAKTRGLYPDGKFTVRRKDGSDAPDGKHNGCEYFVLDLTHDTHAMPALRAYAASARADGYEALADDLERIAPAPPSTSAAIRAAAEEIASAVRSYDLRGQLKRGRTVVANSSIWLSEGDPRITESVAAILSRWFGKGETEVRSEVDNAGK